ncbi:redoxin family protein [Herbihabitans rhizosphaerae]|uniref:redoxin family protein n=1 Tax=Herbihabitans rhizosphaerae TaxID=1872711 RepID=UPI001A9107D7|nr:redoxin family protein [Herbihabitans rhizosphaerae]
MTRTIGLVIAAALATLTACGSNDQPAGQPPASPPAQTGAPTTGAPPAGTPTTNAQSTVPEKLRFTAKTVDGKDFDGASLAGKPTVLWFWAPWCPKCQREAPGIAATARHSGAGVNFVGVGALGKEPQMREFVQRFDVGGFTHLADTESAVWKRFGVTAQPAYAFIAADGKVEVVTSQLTTDQLHDKVHKIGGA